VGRDLTVISSSGDSDPRQVFSFKLKESA